MSEAPQKRPAFEPPVRLLRPTGYDPDMPRPASTTAGTVLVLLRVVAGVIVLLAIGLGWQDIMNDPELVAEGWDPGSDASQTLLLFVMVVGAIVLLFDLLLAFLIFRGRNWARVFMMFLTMLSISGSFVAWWLQGQAITIDTTFFSLSIDILILLALSSRGAAAYARRNERH